MPQFGLDRTNRRAHECDLSGAVVTRLVERSQRECTRSPRVVEVAPGDVPSLGAEGERDRTADQAGADDLCTTFSHGSLG